MKWTKEELEYLNSNKTMSDSDVATNIKRSEDAVRNKRKRMGLTVESASITDRHKQESIAKYDRQFVNGLLKEKTNRDIIIDILKEVVPAADFTPKPFVKTKESANTETAVLPINDVHIGRYSAKDLQKKADEILRAALHIINIQRQGATINELVILMCGDIVDGDGIFPNQAYEQKFHLMEQIFTYGLPIFTNLLNELSNNFSKVTINCVYGNHGRVSKFTTPELNFDLIFYKCLELATANNKRIEWNIFDNWYGIVQISKFGFLITHGHYIKTWLNIPFYGIKEKGMRWQGSLTRQETIKIKNDWVRIQKEYWDFIVMGHFHTSLYFRWNNWRCILNGTWLDRDDFSESVLGLDSATEQTIFGVHEKRGITWMRNIDLSIN